MLWGFPLCVQDLCPINLLKQQMALFYPHCKALLTDSFESSCQLGAELGEREPLVLSLPKLEAHLNKPVSSQYPFPNEM